MKQYWIAFREDGPAYYDLSLGHDSLSLIIRIRDLRIVGSPKPWALPKTTTDFYAREYGLTGDFANFDLGHTHGEKFGFGGCFQVLRNEHSGTIDFVGAIPCARDSWDAAYALSGSLQLLLTVLEYSQDELGRSIETSRQLLKLQTSVIRKHPGGGAFAAEITPVFASWLKRYPAREMTRAKHAILAAQRIVWPGIGESPMNAEARILHPEFGTFGLTTIGQCACFGPEGHKLHESNGGYEACSHNVDTPLQQITLLAGFAALCDEAREAGVGLE